MVWVWQGRVGNEKREVQKNFGIFGLNKGMDEDALC